MLRIFLLLGVLAVTCSAVPEGYILEVTHVCGTARTSATITIKSDLHVTARLKCDGGDQNMNPINDTVYETSAQVFYSTSGSSCVFKHPNENSTLYAIELEVGYGFRNESLMDEYESYTITCTTEDHGSDTLASKNIDNGLVPLIDMTKQLGSAYDGIISVKLIDILGDEITGSNLPMAKKVYLQVTVVNGTATGLTPFNCYASSDNGDNRYDLLVAGCGDGVIFTRKEGFTTVGKVATSPMFRVFNLRSFSGNTDKISFSCSITTCTSSCDGSSCSLRQKRSADQPEDEVFIHTPTFRVNGIPDIPQADRAHGENPQSGLDEYDPRDPDLKQRLEADAMVTQIRAKLRKLKQDMELKIAEIKISAVGAVALVALLLASVALIRSIKKKEKLQKVVEVIKA